MSIASSGAGHGARKTNGNWTDPGAIGSGYKEADVARTINNKMLAIAKCKDTTDNAGTSINSNLANIAKNINNGPNGYAISNHLNAFNGKATGVEVLYGSSADKVIAAKLSAAIAKALGLVDRGAKDGSWLYLAANTGPGKKVLLIEWAFIDNKSDMQKLMSKMDVAVKAAMEVLGYKVTSGSSSGNSNNSTGLAKNPKPVTAGKVGDTVKVYDALYRDSTGAGRSTAKRGSTGKIKRIYGNSKKYLIEDWGWAHSNDIQLVKAASSSTSTAVKLPSGFTSEKAKFKNGNQAITTRTDKPSTKGKVGVVLKAGQTVEYLGWKVAEGYTWIYTKDKRYIPVRPTGKAAWGTFI